jgi:hypothetical protein
MGQQMLIIALLASFLVSSAVLGLRDTWNESNEIATNQFEEEQTINLSSSGVNMCISKLRQDKHWRAGYTKVALADGGYLNAQITALGGDSVRITSTGLLNKASHTSIVDVQLASAVPMAESALAIYGDEVKFLNSGKTFGIDGNDHDENGNRVVGSPVMGMAVPSAEIEKDIESQLVAGKVAKNVTGTGSNPSVGIATITNEQVVKMRDFFRSNATKTLPAGKYASNTVYGSLAKPEILYLDGDVEWTGTVEGTGILIVDGPLKIGGNFNWVGLIITVAQDSELEFGDHGNPEINGAVMIGTEAPYDYKVTNVKINGNPQINYSNSALTKVMANLGLNEVQVLNYYE